MRRVALLLGLALLPALLVGAMAATAPPEEGQAHKVKGKARVLVLAPGGATDVAWGLDPTDSSQITSARVRLGGGLPAGSWVCAQVTSGPDSILANGCLVLDSLLAAGAPATVPFDSTPSEAAAAAAVTGVSITVVQIVAGANGPNGLRVADVSWVPTTADTTLVGAVAVQLDGVSGVFRVKLTLKNRRGSVLQRRTFIGQQLPGTVAWALEPPVSARAIARLDIEVKETKK